MSLSMGHNKKPSQLDLAAHDATIALKRIAENETDAISEWIAYGVALNEGRAQFAGDAEFGKWMEDNSLYQLGNAEVHPNERLAAMWAAGNPEQFEAAKQLGNARTVRGIYAKHLEHKRFQEEVESALQSAADFGQMQNNDWQHKEDDDTPLSEKAAPKSGSRENIVDLQGRDPGEFNRAMHYVGAFERVAKDLSGQPHDQVIPTLNDKERQRLRAAIKQIDAIADKTITRI